MKVFILSTLFFIVCSLLQAQESYVVFGSGGGFTGIANVYKVDKNGNVLKGSARIDTNYTDAGKIKKSQAKKLFCKMNKVATTPFNHPGNMYYFISYFHNDKEIKYTWGENDFKVPEEIITLYRETVSKLSKLEYSPVKNN